MGLEPDSLPKPYLSAAGIPCRFAVPRLRRVHFDFWEAGDLRAIRGRSVGKVLAVSDDMDFDVSAIPPTLELLEVKVPLEIRHIDDGLRLFTPCVEFYNLFTVIRVSYPLQPDGFMRGDWGSLYIRDENGIDYGLGGGGGGGNTITFFAYTSTERPVPVDARELHVSTDLGRFSLKLPETT